MQIKRTYKFVKDRYLKENGLVENSVIEKIKLNSREIKINIVNRLDIIADNLKLLDEEFEVVVVEFKNKEEYGRFKKPVWLEEIKV